MFLSGCFFVILSIFLITSDVVAQGIKKGLWEITTETKMEGVDIKIPPMTNQVCVTSDKYIPTEPEKNTNCKMLYNKQEGNTVTWKAICKEKGSTVESTGKMIYSGDTFTGNIDTIMIEGSNKFNSKMTMKGKYTGLCK